MAIKLVQYLDEDEFPGIGLLVDDEVYDLETVATMAGASTETWLDMLLEGPEWVIGDPESLDFVRSIAAYWKRRYTTSVAVVIRQADLDPRSRLFALAEAIIGQDLAKYDVAVRAWASREPAVARIVRQVDDERLGVLRELFAPLAHGAEVVEQLREQILLHIAVAEPARRGALRHLGALGLVRE